MGSVSAAFSAFFGGLLTQHRIDFHDGSDWSYLNDQLSVAIWLCLLALVCGVVFLVVVWSKGLGNDDRFA
jgi:disulfide bond formation protein DsbB